MKNFKTDYSPKAHLESTGGSPRLRSLLKIALLFIVALAGPTMLAAADDPSRAVDSRITTGNALYSEELSRIHPLNLLNYVDAVTVLEHNTDPIKIGPSTTIFAATLPAAFTSSPHAALILKSIPAYIKATSDPRAFSIDANDPRFSGRLAMFTNNLVMRIRVHLESQLVLRSDQLRAELEDRVQKHKVKARSQEELNALFTEALETRQEDERVAFEGVLELASYTHPEKLCGPGYLVNDASLGTLAPVKRVELHPPFSRDEREKILTEPACKDALGGLVAMCLFFRHYSSYYKLPADNVLTRKLESMVLEFAHQLTTHKRTKAFSWVAGACRSAVVTAGGPSSPTVKP